MAYYNPHITGLYNAPYTLNNQGLVIAHLKNMLFISPGS